MTKSLIESAISHTTDGPVGAFCMMSRAANLVRTHPEVDAEEVANCLYELLEEFGFLSSASDIPSSEY